MEPVDQMELVNVTTDFTWMIVQVSLRYSISFEYCSYCEKNCDQEKICEFEAEGQELIHKTNLF